ncbi:DsrE family protein [Chlorobaculum sp. MV4-Y]|uniref:DsrE family protein n=1 Tax=Chlorobaculum sp. MV4-Y TaxID=2976335 RepID=UPI0021AEED5E|nr:DsrE family protein [Chlorobaculum sp. MV4-Y]UWX58479.1 DsrE family protein [Chlorobaculum sp. MV4-Y]
MSLFRKSFTILAFALTAIFSFGATLNPLSAESQPSAVQPASKGLFVVVTSDDPMTQMMAMVLSAQTLNQGRSVRVLICGKAGELVLKGSKEKLFKPVNKSPQMMLKELMAKGVKVEVCPLYLPNTGKQPSALIDGVTVAQPPAVAAAMAEDGIKLFTF